MLGAEAIVVFQATALATAPLHGLALRHPILTQKAFSMRAIFLALALFLPLAAHAQSNDTSNPIIARTSALVEAYNTQNLYAISVLYAENAALFAPGQGSILGRDAIVEFYANAYATGVRDMQFMTMDIRSVDGMAVEVGETVVQNGETRVVSRYMHLWEVIDGEILMTRDMFHVLTAQ